MRVHLQGQKDSRSMSEALQQVSRLFVANNYESNWKSLKQSVKQNK